jgi:hypothetical protein
MALVGIATTDDRSGRPVAAPAPWPLGRRIAFRFAFVYLLLYNAPFPLDLLPGGEWLEKGTHWLRQKLVLAVGQGMLHLPYPIETSSNSGSGDKTYDYVLLLCLVALAAVATAIWSLLVRRRTNDEKLWEWLRVYLRYVLAWAMFSYGFEKVFKLQFPAPSPWRLAEPIGEASPMGLLWTFMGASTPYTVFSGLAEVLGGALLLSRRTLTLGAMVVCGVMTNVVVLNYCYDVCVKLYSTHLLAMALLVLVPDLRRLADVLVLHRPTQPASIASPFSSGWRRHARIVLKAVFLAYALYANVGETFAAWKKYGDHAPRIALYGLYQVEQTPDQPTASWRTIGFTNAAAYVTLADRSTLRFNVKDDPAVKKLSLVARPAEPGHDATFSYSPGDQNDATLDGTYDGVRVHLKLRKIEQPPSLLMTRGFHWINEYPFNR